MRTIVATLLVVGGCAGAAVRDSVVIPPAPITVPGDNTDICALAMGAAAKCGCPWATDAGADTCRRDQAVGNASQLAPACLAEAGTCSALESCPGVTECVAP